MKGTVKKSRNNNKSSLRRRGCKGTCQRVCRCRLRGKNSFHWDADGLFGFLSMIVATVILTSSFAAAYLYAGGMNKVVAQDLARMLHKGNVTVVNVLSPKSFKSKRIRKSINIPLNVLKEVAPEKLPDKNQRIVVYCSNYQCTASDHGYKVLRKLGYRNVWVYKGGVKDWIKHRKKWLKKHKNRKIGIKEGKYQVGGRIARKITVGTLDDLEESEEAVEQTAS